MSDRVSAADAAAAALSVQQSGGSVSVVLRVCDGTPANRIIVFADGTTHGTLGDPRLDAAAVSLAAESRGRTAALSRTVVLSASDEALANPLAQCAIDVSRVAGAVSTPAVTHTLYIETHTPVERLVVVGAGHIAVPLAALGAMLDFDVTVLDDREEFATSDRFDERVRVITADFAVDPFAGVVIDDRTYVTLVTRGHRWDFDCLTRLLAMGVNPRYIGMIGSRRRVRAAFEALEAAGIDRERLGRIHAPIGIDIGADTPAEIALSIAAELVAIRRNAGANDRAAVSLKEREQVAERLLPST
jgi:xanthine dehydrogenase accessory factor